MEFLLESSHENGICAGAFDGSFTVQFERNFAFWFHVKGKGAAP